MPVLVDPRTGEQYDYDGMSEKDIASDSARFGLQTLDQYQLQQEHGGFGEQLATAGKSALESVATLGGVLSPIPFSDQSLYEQQAAANPTASGIGKAVGSLPAYAALGAVSGGAGAALAEGLGASPALAAATGVLAESAATGAAQEEQEASAQGRGFSATGALNSGILNAAFGTLGLALGPGFRSVTGRSTDPLEETAERAIQRRVPSALLREGPIGESISDRAREVVARRIDGSMDQLGTALDRLQIPISNNSLAQRQAIRSLAEKMRDAQPELSDRLEAIATRPTQERFRGMLGMQSGNPSVSAELDSVRSDPALWGDRAVTQGQAILSARAARSSGPGAVLDAVQPIDDPEIRKITTDLAQHLDDAGGIESARTFREARSVGAAGNGPELLPAEEVAYYVRHDDDIVDRMRTIAGGGEGEKGAFQDFNESFREVTNNRVKHQDFVDAAPKDDATRSALMSERDQIASSLDGVADVLKSRGARSKAKLIETHVSALNRAPPEEIASALDRSKQMLDDLHLKAVVDKTDPYGEVIDAVDPVVERIRSTLENPQYVGDKISELQQVRNAAWSDPENGFIHNMAVANETGVKLFKRIARDYHTGDLVMQFDPAAFRSLIGMDWHDSKPVLEAWAKVLDSAERMAENAVEVGASSAARTPVSKLQSSIQRIRQVFEAQAKRLAVRDVSRSGIEGLAQAEQMPIIGKFVSAGKGLLGKENLEAAVAGAGARFIPVPRRSVGEASEELSRIAGEPRVGPVSEPTPPDPSQPPPAAPGAMPLRKAEPSPVSGGGTAAAGGDAERSSASAEDRRVIERMRQRIKQSGYVVLGKRGGTPKTDFYQLPMTGFSRLSSPKAGAIASVKNEATAASAALSDAEREKVLGFTRGDYVGMRNVEREGGSIEDFESAKSKTTIVEPTNVGPLYRGMRLDKGAVNELLAHDDLITAATTSASYSPATARRFAGDEQGAVIFKITKQETGSYAPLARGLGHPSGEYEILLPKGAKYKITNRQRLDSGQLLITVKQTGVATIEDMAQLGALGYVDTGAGGGLSGIATSPLGLVSGAGALGIGGSRAYQSLQDPEEERRSRYMRALNEHSSQDLQDTARALTDHEYAAEWARHSPELPSTLGSFQGMYATLQQAYTERREAIEQATQHPEAMIEKMSNALGGLPAQVAAKAFQVAQYLAAQLPPQRGVTVSRPSGLPPDPLEARAWALKYQTAVDPGSAFDDAKRGRLRREQIDTLKSLWPDRYDDLRTTTLLALGSGRSSVNQRMRADLLFEFGAAMDPAFSRDLAALAKAAYARRKQQSGSTASAPSRTRLPPAMTPSGIRALQMGTEPRLGQ